LIVVIKSSVAVLVAALVAASVAVSHYHHQ
jgi:hypothetical protein